MRIGYDVLLCKGRNWFSAVLRSSIGAGCSLLGADVLARTLADAVLGTIRARDIGEAVSTPFRVPGADSPQLLTRGAAANDRDGASSMRIACHPQAPKVSPIATDAENPRGRSTLPRCVGLKGTTTEGLGFTGRGEGIAAQAVVLMERIWPAHEE
jgi:2-C-methyl-D-erythritol 2,4-cyclodiphosphate synthase